jgi:hypothetical protein
MLLFPVQRVKRKFFFGDRASGVREVYTFGTYCLDTRGTFLSTRGDSHSGGYEEFYLLAYNFM